MITNYNSNCKPSIFLNENVNITKNKADFITYCSHMSVYINGIITVMGNDVALDVISCQFCDITFYNLFQILHATVSFI